ncbi:MAG: hypothetical protein ACOYL6_00785 [Bacteriovoracaceae bacterium]
MEASLSDRVEKLEKETNQLFKVVFEQLDSIKEQVTPKLPANRKKIGLRANTKD